VNPRASKLIWQGSAPQGRQFHETKIAARTGAAEPLRGFTQAQKAKIGTPRFTNVDTFIGARTRLLPKSKP
jgi:hypothetical protein